ncbi:hypothetical protein BVER_02594c [Candidatus Burkholderia verschuerenii]|uniref:Lysozyme inhibitor LprI N-terminal domain-containing protein n=1 Tax=Candidatus Burkholderia verschuerenii TaxID=242163 RepID=A0A0L0M8Z8_9BURK|nr:hypothetical protein [Candidatus Burkholderia verschuerenii]KND59122.1 hypothetical protein BVER_02594c [Candidatus Burkholderia verschuerenii]
MKALPIAGLLLMAASAIASPPTAEYPSCQIKAQHAVTGETGDAITDVRQAHIRDRANILQADIGTARKTRRLSQAQADSLWKRVDRVRHEADDFVVKQGFLSAAERAGYDRELDEVALQLCQSARV